MGFRLMENFDIAVLRDVIGDSGAAGTSRCPPGSRTTSTAARRQPATAGDTSANLLIVFLLSGLWHGAAWTFVIWGLCTASIWSCSVVTSQFQQQMVAAFTWIAWARD